MFFPLIIISGQYRSPRITEHPKDVLVKKNEPTTLNCKAEGKPEPIIEWYKDGELLNNSPGNDGRRIFLPGGDLFFLSVSDGKKESDSGTYWCIARNQVGNVQSRNASLVVGGKLRNSYYSERELDFMKFYFIYLRISLE